MDHLVDGPLSRQEVRRRHRELRQRAVEQALSRRGEELATRRAVIRAELARVRGGLVEGRQTASAELDAAVRRLRDDARSYLDRADRADRARYPELLTGAADELARRMSTRLDVLFAVPSPRADSRPPRIPPLGRPIRDAVQDRLAVLFGASGGFGLWRVASIGPVGELGVVLLAVTVAVGVGGMYWLARARRASADRGRLRRWTDDVVADLRAGLEATATERMYDAQRRREPAAEHAANQQLALLEVELRRYEQVARRVTGRGTG